MFFESELMPSKMSASDTDVVSRVRHLPYKKHRRESDQCSDKQKSVIPKMLYNPVVDGSQPTTTKKGSALYYCSICKFTFPSITAMATHSCTNVTEDGSFLYDCTNCKGKFLSETALSMHKCGNIIIDPLSSRYPIKKIQSLPVVDGLQPTTKKGSALYYCSICKFTFTSVTAMATHSCNNVTEEDSLYDCINCKSKFLSETLLSMHKCGNRIIDPLSSRYPIKKIPSRPVVDESRPTALTGPSMYVCSICKGEFVSIIDMHMHSCTLVIMDSIGFKKKIPSNYVCVICREEFKYLTDLHMHELMHGMTEDNSRKSSLTSCFYDKKLKLYRCFLCGFCLKTSKKLCRHLKLHSSLKVYTCSDCLQSVPSVHGIISHFLLHRASFYECDFCLEIFKTFEEFSNHKSHHCARYSYPGTTDEAATNPLGVEDTSERSDNLKQENDDPFRGEDTSELYDKEDNGPKSHEKGREKISNSLFNSCDRNDLPSHLMFNYLSGKSVVNTTRNIFALAVGLGAYTFEDETSLEDPFVSSMRPETSPENPYVSSMRPETSPEDPFQSIDMDIDTSEHHLLKLDNEAFIDMDFDTNLGKLKTEANREGTLWNGKDFQASSLMRCTGNSMLFNPEMEVVDIIKKEVDLVAEEDSEIDYMFRTCAREAADTAEVQSWLKEETTEVVYLRVAEHCISFDGKREEEVNVDPLA